MKNLVTLLYCLVSLTASAQQIHNAGFEDWHTVPNGATVPDSFWTADEFSNNHNTVLPSTDAHSGMYSLFMETRLESSAYRFGSAWYPHPSRYVSFTDKPAKLKFWYKFHKVTNDARAGVIVHMFDAAVSHNNGGNFIIDEETPVWTEGEMSFSYSSNFTPATMQIIIMVDQDKECKLWIDDLSWGQATSLPDQDASRGELHIFPNPAVGVFSIMAEIDRFDVSVTDLTGKLIHQSKDRYNKTTIDCSTWAKGMYLVKVRTEKSVYTEKLIVQ